jgi:hypothetical protein
MIPKSFYKEIFYYYIDKKYFKDDKSVKKLKRRHNMKKFVIIISLGIILSAVMLCGCNDENGNGDVAEKTFIGKWKIDMEGFEDHNETWNFLENGRVTKVINQGGDITTEFFEWEDTGDELCIIPQGRPEDKRCGIYTFKDNNKSFEWNVLEIKIIYRRISE